MGLWAEVAFNIHDDLYITIDGTEFAGNGQGQVFQNGPELELERFLHQSDGGDGLHTISVVVHQCAISTRLR